SGESGQNTTASGEQSCAIGANVESSGNSSIAIGGDDLDDASKVNGVNELFNTYTGSTDGLVTVGDYNNHTESGGAASVAIGVKAHSKGDLSTAVGVRSSSSGDASSAFGMGSSASKKGSVALGAGSTTLTDATYQDKLTIGNKDYLYAGATNDKGAQVSVGSSGRERQIKHVASGEVSAVSTDAINGSQLHATNEAIGDLGSTVSDGLNFVGDRGAVINRQLGDTLNIKGGAAPTTPLTNKNIGIRNDGSNGLIVELAEKVNLGTNGSVNIGNTQVKNTGITIAGSTLSNTVVLNNNGLNNGGFKVVNIDKGNVNATSTEAINGSQLFGTAQSIADNFGGGSIVNADGTVSNPVYQINGNNQTGVAGAIEELDKGFNLETNDANTSTVKAGDTIDIGTSTGETNIEVAKTGNDIKFKLADNIDLNSVKTGNSVLNNNGLTINNGPSFTATGINAGNQQITKVSSGGKLTDINNQLNAANIGDVKNAIGDVTTLGFGIKAADNNTVQKNLGEVVQIVGSNSNITTKVVNGKVAVDLNNNLDLGKTGSVKMGGSSLLAPATTVNGLGLLTGNVLGSTAVTGAGIIVNGPLGIPSTTLTTNGLNIIGGPSVTRSGGVNAGGKQITNVASGGTTLTNAANIGDVKSAAAGSRTEVVKGTNVTSVDKTAGSNGQNIYTINANGTTVSSASSGALTVTPSTKDTNNVTDYKVDLSADTKASLVSADNALQTVVTQIDGIDVKTLNKTNNTANFLKGDNILLTPESGGIKVATAQDMVLNSVKMGNTTVSRDGMTIVAPTVARTVVLSSAGLNNGGNKITNVLAGTQDTDAVNVKQLNLANTTIDKGLSFGGDSGTDVNRKLGETLTVKGGDTINADPATKNISVTANGEDTLTVRLAKDINLGETGSVTTGNTQVNNAGITLYRGGNGQVALTNNGLNNGNNKITNVAQGTTGKDAVNFDQLSLTNTNVSTNAAGIKTNKDNIAKGIKIGDGDSANDQQFALGSTINVTGDSNITTTASATGVQVKLNNQLNLGDDGRMQMGTSLMNNAGFTFVGNEPGRTVILGSGGLNNGFNRITNVAAGLDPTDAATVGQLSAATFALDKGWALSAQGDEATMVKQGSAFDLNSRDGNIKISRTAAASSVGRASRAVDPNDMTFDLNRDIAIDSVQTGDTTINNQGITIVGGPSVTKAGINAADTKVTNVVNGEVAANSKDAINGGQLYAQGAGISSIIGGNTTYDPVTGTFTNSNIGGTGQASIDGAIASIKRGEAVMTESIQTNTSNITKNTANIATNTANISTNTTNIKANKDKIDAGLNFGADSGAVINKPIGDGSVMSFKGGNNITTTAEGSSIKFDLNGNINVESVTTGNTTVNNSGMIIKNGPSMTAAGIYAGNTETAPSMTAAGINAAGTKVTNVADGMAPRDAVNYGQLEAVTRGLGGSINELGYKIGEVEDDANAGISAAMAMSSLPQAYIIGKPMIGGGIATFNGESAVAIGFSKMSNDGRWVMKLNGTADTQGNVGGAIGAGFHFD
ncbi:MAG TPA: hypothetical protein DCX43_00530, partial [Psychrobacter sp.]|nr:hypothetical protein [Psychrobacter sp.]